MSKDISIQNLRKVFKTDDSEVVAVEDLSLDVKAGELVSILGPSGSGKTTILRLIAGLTEPTSGKVMLGDRESREPGPDRGMVFQDFALFPWRSVRKNVEFGLELVSVIEEPEEGSAVPKKLWDRKGLPKEERRELAEKAIELVGLTKFADARIHELSGGMKQRVGIARALVTNPDVLLMDEPFGALDAQTRNIMQTSLLNILDKTDQTILFVTHSVDEACFLSDRIVILTKRPARIKEIIEIPWAHPRDRAAPEFTALRKRILKELEEENVMD